MGVRIALIKQQQQNHQTDLQKSLRLMESYLVSITMAKVLSFFFSLKRKENLFFKQQAIWCECVYWESC